jgi:2-dehydropantoate 2-reductase
MKVAVVGPGAMGCLFAGLLKRSGVDVVIVDRRPDRSENISGNGLSVTGISGDFKADVEASCDTQAVAAADFVFIWTKSYDTARAVESLPLDVGDNTLFVTLQNGVGNAEAIAEKYGAGKVLAGTTSDGATLLGAGQVRHCGRGTTTVGALEPANDDRARSLVQTLADAGFNTAFTDNVQAAIWKKLIVNAAINPLTALLGVRNGRLVEIPAAREMLGKIALEALHVAIATNALETDFGAVELVETVCENTATNISSMLQDILAGRRTEISAINGAVASVATSVGEAAPLNDTVARLVTAMEGREPYWKEELVAAED